MSDLLDLRMADCMEVMKSFPDNYFDLAVVDPPYGIDAPTSMAAKNGKIFKGAKVARGTYNAKEWDKEIPSVEYFEELFRVSKNQIIWGGNYMVDVISESRFEGAASRCWLVWDKVTGTTDFADAELAWTSFKTSVRHFRFMWNGMIQGDMKNKEKRIHPTQKPVRLYSWIYEKFAKKGMKILDTHLGSGSSAIAAYQAGLEFVGCELDQTYFDDMQARVERKTSQGMLL